MTPPSDEEFIHRFKAGDIQAFEGLYRTHYRRLFFFIRRCLSYTPGRVESEVDDLTQETMLRAYKNLHRFESRAKFGTWLFSIALNLIRSRFRGKPLPSSLETLTESGSQDSGFIASSGPSPEEKTEQSLMSGLLKEAIATLTERERAVFMLREMEDLSFQEIADLNGEGIRNQQRIKEQADRKLRNFFVAKGIDLR